MKILFCGLGSIGSRHIKNLSLVLNERGIEYSIDALRSSNNSLSPEVASLLRKSYSSFEELPSDYDVAFITNPTSLHEATITALADKTRDMFIEKPVFSGDYVNLDAIPLKQENVYYVACPLRHTPVVKRLHELCQKEKPIAVRSICSSYLPEWRKDTDYRECYSASREKGGGVVLDLIHEWDYLTYLLDFPYAVKMFSGQRSRLEITSDDVAVYIANFSRTLLSLQLDYVGRVPLRTCELYFDDEVVVGDILNRSVVYKKAGKTESFDNEDFYINEMNYFIDCVLERRADNMNTVENAVKVLKIASCKE